MLNHNFRHCDIDVHQLHHHVYQDWMLEECMDDSVILAQASEISTDFLIYTGNFCGYCVALKRLLDRKGLSYTEFNFDEHPDLRSRVVNETGHRTVPVVIDLRTENPTYVGGFNETNAMLR